MRAGSAAPARARSSKPQPASSSAGAGQQQPARRAAAAHQTTTFTSRPGHDDDLLRRACLRRTWRSPGWPARRPRSPRCRPSAARVIAPRSLPLTCSTSSISSCTSAASSTCGQGASSRSPSAAAKPSSLPQRQRDVRAGRVQRAQQDAAGLRAARRRAAPRRAGLERVEQLHRAGDHGVVLHALVVVADLAQHACAPRGAAPCARAGGVARRRAGAAIARACLTPKAHSRRRKRCAPSTPASFHSSVCSGGPANIVNSRAVSAP